MMRSLRWTGRGVLDGTLAGLVTGALVMFVAGLLDRVEGDGFRALLGAVSVAAVHGAVAGLCLGLVAGLLIDLLRISRLSERVAVWMVIVPILALLLWWMRPRSPSSADALWWAFPLVVAAVVIADLSWRLRRQGRRAPA